MNNLPLQDFPQWAISHNLLFAKHFSAYINRLCQSVSAPADASAALTALAGLVCYAKDQGHVCLDLTNPPVVQDQDTFLPVQLPPLDSLLALLRQLPPDCLSWEDLAAHAPLLLVTKGRPRLYLSRYWQYERQLEARIRKGLHIPANATPVRPPDCLFAADQMDSLQYQAVAKALTLPLSLIAGGPGTGKTTIAVKVLAAKLLQNPDATILMAAPTGKAAARMKEAIENTLPNLSLDAPVGDKIRSIAASTIHRLLGARPVSPDFLHNRANPLTCDFLVIDEASMIDLPLMAKLLDAVGEHTSVLLIGDPFQLPSVEVGSIFGDIIQSTDVAPAITTLTENFRAREAKLIIDLCTLINDRKLPPDAVMEWLRHTKTGDMVSWVPIHQPADMETLIKLAADSYREVVNSDAPPLQRLANASKLRVLTPLRKGAFGMNSLNRKIEQRLRSESRLLIITSNDAEVGLFNGDVGLLCNDPAPKVYFSERSAPLSPLRIPAHESAYVMTGHRAQGSEFDWVHIILPTDAHCPLLTREWLYTAISRAKKGVTLWASDAAIRACLQSSPTRNSGLLAP